MVDKTEQTNKMALDELSKEEIIQKYKSLLGIAKKAKLAKDELTEENRTLKETLSRCETQKEADKKALITMKEMLEQFTEQKLQLTTQLNELQQKHTLEVETLAKTSIENESLQRQLQRLTEENESLLSDIDRMESQLQQVNLLGKEQQQNLVLLEREINCLKETEAQSASLQGRYAVLQQEQEATAADLTASKSAYDVLLAKYDNVKQINAEQRHKFNSLKERFIEVHRKLKNLQQCKHILLETQHEYAEAVSKWQSDIVRASNQLCAQMHTLKNENEQLLAKLQKQTVGNPALDNMSLKLLELERLSVTACAEHKRMQDDLAAALQQCSAEKSDLETKRLTQELQDLRAQLSDMKRLQAENAQLQAAQEGDLEPEEQELLQRLSDLEKTVAEKGLETCKLRAALEETHDALEKIEQEHIELLEQIQCQNVSERPLEDAPPPASLSEELDEDQQATRQSYEELCARHEQQEREHLELLGEMRELNEALKARGDVISRQQEKQQELLGELKRVSSQLKQSEREREQLEQQVRELNEELQHFRASELDAQSDVPSETFSRAEEISRLREADDSFEHKYNKLRGLAVKLKKKLQEQTSQIATLEEEQQVAQSNVELEALQKQVESLKVENQKLKCSRKQANVLNLEIEAAEKTLAESSEKLLAKTQQLESVREQLSASERTVTQLRRELKILESDKAAECAHAQQLKAQIELLQQQIKDAVYSKQQTHLQSKQYAQQAEQLQLELEELRMRLSESASQQQQQLAEATEQRAQLERQAVEAAEALKQTQTRLQTAERALQELRLEHNEYKAKAQAVLRKHQNQEGQKARELDSEVLSLRASEQQLRSALQQEQSKMLENAQRLTSLSEDNQMLQKRNKELLGLLEELRQQQEQLAQEQRQQLLLQQEALRTQRQQMEQLQECHEQQLQELQASHRLQLEQIRAPTVGAAVSTPEQSKIDFLLMEREAGEGSDEADAALAALAAKRKISSTRRSQHDFMPLDELLNAPISAISDTVTTITANSYGRGDDIGSTVALDSVQHELNITRERLEQQERRAHHLTALLAENEQDLAKLTQMNDMLKEELRRQERSVEREQHMHNSEYLKNVVLKFLTLNNNDERTRLVPVLNTILKLSRNEAEILNTVAKGQKISTEASNRAWSNFLPWSGSTSNH